MKVLLINVVCGIRSTGRICTDLADMLNSQKHEVKIAYGRGKVPKQFQKYAVRIGTMTDVIAHGVSARIKDSAGFGSEEATKRFIEWVKEYDPDVIHLHNLHGYYINVDILFQYLKTCGKKIVWSLHDCWAITGHCAHFDYNQCNKWKTACDSCAFIKEYPKSIVDNSKHNYLQKKKCFTDVEGIHLIVPSEWLRSVVNESFLHGYSVEMIPGGIDLDLFYKRKSNIRERTKNVGRFVILGVSSFWNSMKGIDTFRQIAARLSPKEFSIVLIGKVKNTAIMPPNITFIPSTDSIEELCKYYSMADVFLNPTLQETQGLTTIEALACGTPVIVYNSGGAAECVKNGGGIVVSPNDIEAVVTAIYQIKNREKIFDEEECIRSAQLYNKNKLYTQVIELYKNI